jgi:hypothetical protein
MIKRISVSILVLLTPLAHAEKAKKPQSEGKTHSEAIEELISKRRQVRGDIDQMNEKLNCDVDGDCDVIEAGWRPCGGPSAYIIVSAKNKKHKSIKTKIDELTRVERDLANAEGVADCTPVPTLPEARCIEEKCQPKTNNK